MIGEVSGDPKRRRVYASQYSILDYRNKYGRPNFLAEIGLGSNPLPLPLFVFF
jgi:hypothetical protein